MKTAHPAPLGRAVTRLRIVAKGKWQDHVGPALRALFGSKKIENASPLFAGFFVENVQSLKRGEVNEMGITFNSRILLAAATILAAVALVVGATFAFFSDVGTSSDNIFNSGTLDMLLTDDNETDQDSVSGTWGLASAPGDTFDESLFIKNSGSVAANHVELKFNNTVTEASSVPGTTATTPLDTVIEITAFEWDSDANGSTETDLLGGVVDNNSNGIIDLDDLETQLADDFDNLSFGGTQSADHGLRIAGRLHPTLTVNEHQGDSVDMDLTTTMNQDASQ